MSPEPPAPRPSATVILLRREGGEPLVYLLRRNPHSGFMGGFYVFPGGTVEAQDRHPDWYRHMDIHPRQFEERFGGNGSSNEILAYLVAAVRETLEEAGVLLGYKPEAFGSDDADRTHRLRCGEDFSREWFRKAISSEGWKLAASRIHRWARWVTPEQMQRRFDTRFFLTGLPEYLHCRPDGHETVHGIWLSPRQALAANSEGRTPLSPPTLMTMQEMLFYETFDSLLKAAEKRHWGDARMPRLVRLDGGERLILAPWDPAYHQRGLDIEPGRATLLPPGTAFSRMLLKDGVWRPIFADI